MKRIALIGAMMISGAASLAQTPPPGAMPPPPPRARGPQLALAVEMAQTAVATCLANGYKTTALVVDSAGVPVALLSGDGVAERTQMIAPTKIAMVMKYREASGVTLARSKTDAALAQALKDDAKIGTPRQGALPILVGSDIIGAVAVSGAPGGDKDEVCAQAGIDKVKARLR